MNKPKVQINLMVVQITVKKQLKHSWHIILATKWKPIFPFKPISFSRSSINAVCPIVSVCCPAYIVVYIYSKLTPKMLPSPAVFLPMFFSICCTVQVFSLLHFTSVSSPHTAPDGLLPPRLAAATPTSLQVAWAAPARHNAPGPLRYRLQMRTSASPQVHQ